MFLKFALSLIFAYAFGLVSDPMCKSEMIGIVDNFFSFSLENLNVCSVVVDR